LPVRVVLSIDMEGVSQLRAPAEILAACPEYWQTGKPRLEADTVAAAEGLLAGGADEVIVLDNHASGNRENVSAGCLPSGARLETWHVFDLPDRGIDAMLQLGYHSRGGGAGFVSHTYGPGLRLRAGDELISESHGRAWAGRAPLIGIVGNDSHEQTLGSLAGTPYLVVQRTIRNDRAEPVFGEHEGLAAIRDFAEQAIRNLGEVPPPVVPRDVVFAASMSNGADQVAAMEAAGWRRAGQVEFEAHLAEWREARPLLAAAMSAAMAPLLPFFDGATSPEAAAALDPKRVGRFRAIVDSWCGASHPEWYTAPADELGLSR
jgi:D-amino peptidase